MFNSLDSNDPVFCEVRAPPDERSEEFQPQVALLPGLTGKDDYQILSQTGSAR